ncbi:MULTISPECIES: DUF5047 domain-containing protein [unclassified Streptomyces]|uniref:DUF5047 domain-containing protein n=1 Tax=unclassified Streptomyces TaxID=2593676 RepID=UPI0033CEDD2C
MYPTTARFLRVIAEDHNPVDLVQLFRTNGQVETLDIIGGTINVNRANAVRRTCSITLADTELIPRTAADKVSVSGAQLRVSRGVVYTDGTSELVPLGLFRIDSVDGDVDEGPVTIQGKSLEVMVADDKFTAPYRASGTAVSAVTALIRRSIPAAAVVVTSEVVDAAIGPRTFDIKGDPWAAVVECAAAIGAEVYADPDGTFTITALPDILAATPAWTIAAGEGGTYVSATRGMSSAGVFNGILAAGESTETATAPVSALVVDSDPGSPTYWSGPYGHRPDFYSSATLTTSGQCIAAGTLKLRAALAPNASAQITCLQNPALAPGDVIRVVYPDGTKELHQAQSFDVQLGVAGDFTIQTVSAKEGT